MILGKFKLNYLLLIYVPLMVLTPCYTYYMAVSQGQEPPYPHATVTSTACHYPQDIEFRYIMLACSSLLILSLFIVFRWLENESQRVDFPPPHKYLFYLSQFSMFCYGITIGTIDEAGIGNLHTPCAIIFFVIWLATIVNLTVYMTKLRRWDTSTISRITLTLNQLLAGYISLIWIWCFYEIYIVEPRRQNKQDIYVVILQWNSVFVNFGWLLSFVPDWRCFNLCLVRKDTKE